MVALITRSVHTGAVLTARIGDLLMFGLTSVFRSRTQDTASRRAGTGVSRLEQIASTGDGSIRPPFRKLWQIPAFLVGLLALIGALYYGIERDPSPRDTAKDDLKTAVAALEGGDYRIALALADQALAKAGNKTHLQGDLRYVMGSAYLMEAEQVPKSEQTASYRRAATELELAEQLGASRSYRSSLQYRLAKAQHFIGAEPARVIQTLENVLDGNHPDRVEGLQFLTRLYLEQKEPNLDGALRANERLLALPDIKYPNYARLLRAELLMKLKRFEEADEVLKRIPEGTAEYSEARYLLAKSFVEKENWAAAQELLTAVAAEDPASSPYVNSGLYYLGLCHARVGRSEEAARVWDRIRRELPGTEEAEAATLQLAELHRSMGRDDQALKEYKAALQAMQTPYHNQFTDLTSVRQYIGAALSKWFESGQHERIRDLAGAYRHLAPVGEAERCFADASQALGLARLKESEHLSGASGQEAVRQARQYFQDAGEAYESVARSWEGQTGYADMLWAAAENYLRAKQYARALPALDRYVLINAPNKKHLEALVGLGEAHHALKHTDQAVDLLQQAAKHPGPLNCRARYLLALAQIEQNKRDEAEETLRGIAKPAGVVQEPPEVRQSQFALGYLLYRRGKYAEAATQLDKTLEQYPNDGHACQARYRLAESYRQGALQEEKNQVNTGTDAAESFYDRQRTQLLQKALDQFQQLAFYLTDLQESQPLTDSEKELLRAGRFGVGDCLYNLGRYLDAVTVYEDLTRTYAARTETLYAYLQMARSHVILRQLDEARQTLERAQSALGAFDDKALQASRLTRIQWQEWLDTYSAEITKKLNSPSAKPQKNERASRESRG